MFAVDVARSHPVGRADKVTRITPFEDRVSEGIDRYGMFIDRREWPEHIRAGYTAARAALDQFRAEPVSAGAKRSGATRS